MKSILVAIFVVGMGGAALWRTFRPMPEAATPKTGECVVFIDPSQGCIEPAQWSRIKIHEYPTCPWWLDPEIWWREDCAGGLPPRLPVPEGLR